MIALSNTRMPNFLFFKQKTAYEGGTGDWSSDVCSSDLIGILKSVGAAAARNGQYKSGTLPEREMGIIKSEGAVATTNGQYKKLPQRELVSIKSVGAAATRNAQYKKRARCCSEKWAV